MLRMWLAVLIGLAAIADDVAHRRISNWIVGAALCSGFGLQVFGHGWRGVGIGLAGALTGGAAFLVFYLLGGMGGGDIKLMAGFGAMLGAGGILAAALWTAGIGGLMAAAVIAFGSLRRLAQRLRQGSVSSRAGTGEERSRADSIPYAPAIAAGVWIALASGV